MTQQPPPAVGTEASDLAVASASRPVRPNGHPYLEARSVSKRYGSVVALDGVDFDLRTGEVMALVGENGAGKSTLVKILAGLVVPDTGVVSIDGAEVDLRSPERARGAGIAVVQQELSLVGPLSAAENVFLGAGMGGFWTQSRLSELAHPYLETVGLGGLDPRTEAARLSVAERQLVEIARLLARDARILILDEPTAALSDVEIARVKTVVRRLASEGRSVMYVTHRLDEVFEIADRVTVFRNGTSQPPVPVVDLDVDLLVERMLGRRLEQMFPPRAEGFGPVLMDAVGIEAHGLAEPTSVSVRAGEIVGLAGQLGSGMRPLLRAIAGVEPTTAGVVRIGERTLSGHTLRSAIAGGIAYCSDDRKLDGIFSIRPVSENLSSTSLPRISPAGVIRRDLEAQVSNEICGFFAIDTKRLPHPVSELSGGNQQKVALGKWIASHPKVVLVEEPTRGVDVGARAEIYAHVRALATGGVGVIFASSDLSEVTGLADTIATFYKGRLIRTGPASQLTEADVLHDVTGGGAHGRNGARQ